RATRPPSPRRAPRSLGRAARIRRRRRSTPGRHAATTRRPERDLAPVGPTAFRLGRAPRAPSFAAPTRAARVRTASRAATRPGGRREPLRRDARPGAAVAAAVRGILTRLSWPRAEFAASRRGEPPRPDDGVIDFLRSREEPDGIIEARPLPSGSAVRVTDGPWRGLVAVLERRVSARERVLVLLDILQRQTRVEMPETWVRLA